MPRRVSEDGYKDSEEEQTDEYFSPHNLSPICGSTTNVIVIKSGMHLYSCKTIRESMISF